MTKFAVVEFLEDKTVELVPSGWIVKDADVPVRPVLSLFRNVF